MKKIYFLFLFLTTTIILTGCSFTTKVNLNTTFENEESIYTRQLPPTGNNAEIIEEFEVGGFYKVNRKDNTFESYVTFYDEVNRPISSISYYNEFIKVPEYTSKIYVYNMTFEKIDIKSLKIYPIDKEIKDEEFGGEKPVYILKKQLVPGTYQIKFRDYLAYQWNVTLYKNNNFIQQINNNNSTKYFISTDMDFEYISIHNCSLIYVQNEETN